MIMIFLLVIQSRLLEIIILLEKELGECNEQVVQTKTRHYSETRYNKPIDFVKELEVFYKKVGKFKRLTKH